MVRGRFEANKGDDTSISEVFNVRDIMLSR